MLKVSTGDKIRVSDLTNAAADTDDLDKRALADHQLFIEGNARMKMNMLTTSKLALTRPAPTLDLIGLLGGFFISTVCVMPSP